MSYFCGVNSGMKFDLIARMDRVDEWGWRLIDRLGLRRYAETGFDGDFFPADANPPAPTPTTGPQPGDEAPHNRRRHATEKLKEVRARALERAGRVGARR